MNSTSRFTYNINSRNINNDINNSYYTYNNNQNYENINKNIIYQSQNINPNDNQNISLLNQSNPLPYYQTYSNENNISYNSYNDNRFIRLNSRLNEINAKINKEKMEKENLILSKISTTEILLDNNNENRMRKIKEIKNSISDISLLFEQIKQSTKQRNKQSDEILEIFENKFNIRLKEEQDKRINLEKRLNTIIDNKFKDIKCKVYDNSKERFNELEDLKSKLNMKIPKLQATVDDERKMRKLKDEEIREKIKYKMNYYNDIMRKEIKDREIFDEKSLDDIKYTFTDFNKQMRQTTFNREQSQGQLIDLVDATISQIEATGNKLE